MTLEPGWLLRQIDAAHERAKRLPNWLKRDNETGPQSHVYGEMGVQEAGMMNLPIVRPHFPDAADFFEAFYQGEHSPR